MQEGESKSDKQEKTGIFNRTTPGKKYKILHLYPKNKRPLTQFFRKYIWKINLYFRYILIIFIVL